MVFLYNRFIIILWVLSLHTHYTYYKAPTASSIAVEKRLKLLIDSNFQTQNQVIKSKTLILNHDNSSAHKTYLEHNSYRNFLLKLQLVSRFIQASYHDPFTMNEIGTHMSFSLNCQTKNVPWDIIVLVQTKNSLCYSLFSL